MVMWLLEVCYAQDEEFAMPKACLEAIRTGEQASHVQSLSNQLQKAQVQQATVMCSMSKARIWALYRI